MKLPSLLKLVSFRLGELLAFAVITTGARGDTPYLGLAADLIFEPEATALGSLEREKAHHLAQVVYSRISNRIASCPDLILIATARADAELPGSKAHRRWLANARLEYIASMFEHLGISRSALVVDVRASKPYGGSPNPNLVEVEGRLDLSQPQNFSHPGQACIPALRQ